MREREREREGEGERERAQQYMNKIPQKRGHPFQEGEPSHVLWAS